MARDRTNYVTLYNPDTGSEVEVSEERGEVLKGRGYTTSKPRNSGRRKGASRMEQIADNTAELQKKLDAANAKIAELEQAPQFPDPQQ